MPRTNADLVKGVLDSEYDTLRRPNLNPYIDSVTGLVTRVNTCAVAKGITYSAVELELLERWLAAHAYKAADKQMASSSENGSSGSFRGTFGENLKSTSFGQMALTLDVSGCLLSLTTQMRAGAAWLGKRRSNQTDYADRD